MPSASRRKLFTASSTWPTHSCSRRFQLYRDRDEGMDKSENEGVSRWSWGAFSERILISYIHIYCTFSVLSALFYSPLFISMIPTKASSGYKPRRPEVTASTSTLIPSCTPSACPNCLKMSCSAEAHTEAAVDTDCCRSSRERWINING